MIEYRIGFASGREIVVSAPWRPERDPTTGALCIFGDGHVVAELSAEDWKMMSGKKICAMAMDPQAPRISTKDYDTATYRAWKELRKESVNDPKDASNFMFRYGNVLARFEHDDEGRPIVVRLSLNQLRHRLNNKIQWTAPSEKGGEKPIRAVPSDLAANIQAAPDPPVPAVSRLVDIPVMTPKGKIHEEEGYNKEARVFHVPCLGLVVPSISERPSKAAINAARDLIVTELLADFKFVSKAEQAHTVALLIQPFVRSLIQGPTPLYLVESPVPGTGKGLLTQACLHPALGAAVPMMTEGGDEGEWRKRITAVLIKAPVAVVIDNVRERLDSSNLSAALTNPLWEDRIMGTSTAVILPILATWVATGNNPSLSDEMTRRVVRIRMDTGMERPETRAGFRHPNLLRWAHEHRGELIAAALTLARAWYVRKQRKTVLDVPSLGSFESWAEVMGGILKVAGIDGFLTNLEDVRAAAGGERTSQVEAFAVWYRLHRDEEVTLSQLDPAVLEAFGIIPFADNLPKQLRSLGMKFSHLRDSRFGPYTLKAGGTTEGTRRWRVIYGDGSATVIRLSEARKAAGGGRGD